MRRAAAPGATPPSTIHVPTYLMATAPAWCGVCGATFGTDDPADAPVVHYAFDPTYDGPPLAPGERGYFVPTLARHTRCYPAKGATPEAPPRITR